ncbi:MAG: WD40 repeat domain-containing protein [Candidatus Aenigmarchaeota archaeon]|nr:WD40 repeat domain-containing protein [Candidatus Aenigmarchaeota archaeon]
MTRAQADTTPPIYGNDTDDSRGEVYDGTIVNISVSWSDDVGLSTAIFRHNATGTWENVSSKTLTGTFDWFNTSINTTLESGKTICWNQWANDTSDNWNTTMGETAHCFNVLPRGILVVHWHPTSEINSVDCIYDGMCPIEQNDTFGIDTNVTCVGGTCGSVEVEARYGNETLEMSLIPTIEGAKPFYVIAGKYPEERVIDYPTSDVLSLDHDANYLYIGSKDTNTYVVNKTDWSLVTKLQPSTFAGAWIRGLANDANYLYVGPKKSAAKRREIFVYNKTDWSLIKTLEPITTGEITSLSVDKNFLYIGYALANEVVVVNKTDWTTVTELTNATKDVNDVDNDENYVYAVSSDTYTYVWNKTWNLVTEILSPDGGSVLAVDHDANYTFTGTNNTYVFIWNKTDWSQVANITNATDEVVALSNDEEYLYAGSWDSYTYIINKATWVAELKKTYSASYVLAVNNDEKYLYIGSADNKVYVSKKGTWIPDKKIKFSDYYVWAVDHDSEYLYIGSQDSKTYVVDTDTWSSVANLTYATDEVYSLSNDEKYLYIGSRDSDTYVVNKTDWSNVTTLTFATNYVNSVDNDEKYVYIGSEDANVYVVNKTDWSLVNTTDSGAIAVFSVSHDSNYLYIGTKLSADGSVLVINKTDWTTVIELTDPTDWVYSVDNDEEYVYAGSRDKKVYVYNKTWGLVTTITFATNWVRSISNDRSDVFIGSEDSNTYIVRKSDWSLKGKVIFPEAAVYSVDNDPGRIYIGSADYHVYVVNKELTNPMYVGYLRENDTAIMRWLVKATGDLGTEWKLDNRYTASIAYENSTQIAWVRISTLTKFTFTAKNESMQLYENTNVTIYDWKGNKVAFQTLTPSNPELSTDLWYDFNYRIVQTSPARDSRFSAKFYDFIIDFNSTLEPQLVENYTNYVPPRSTIYSVYAVNSSQIINITNATLCFPKAVDVITGIFYCKEWNFSAANCSSWKINHTSQYGAQENTTHIWFNVSSFGAYGIGNQQPLPNITEIKVYDVTGVDDKENGGSLVDSGLNTTLSLNIVGERKFRFEVIIKNVGTLPWVIESEDAVFQSGLNETWSIDAAKEIWYNVSSGKYVGGNFTNGNVTWNTSNGGSLNSSYLQESGYFKYLVTISLPPTELVIVDFPEIPNNTAVAQNHTFLMNATVKCNVTNCGFVNGTARYNATSTSADTQISPVNGTKPFYILEDENEKPCPNNPLLQDDVCTLVWNVNATGDLETYWNLDVNFVSNGTVYQNYTLYTKAFDASVPSSSEDYSTLEITSFMSKDTDDHLVLITYPAIHVILKFDIIDFGSLDPGTLDSPALGNDDLLYNVSIPTYSSTVTDLWIKGTNLTGPSTDGINYSIFVGNISWGLENNIANETTLTQEYVRITGPLYSGSILTTYYWIDVPYGKLQGKYNGTIYFLGNTTES